MKMNEDEIKMKRVSMVTLVTSVVYIFFTKKLGKTEPLNFSAKKKNRKGERKG